MSTALKIALTLLIVVPFGRAQVMSPTEYTDFLHKLDAEAMKWQKQVRSFSVEGLPVSYAEGKIMNRMVRYK